MKVADVIGLLAGRFPKAVFVLEKRRPPLKRDIHVDILEILGPAVAPDDLANALRIYCSAIPYLDKLRTGAVRVNLNGEPAGIVTKGEADFAYVMWRKAVQRKVAKRVEREEQERAAKRVLAHRPVLKLRSDVRVLVRQ